MALMEQLATFGDERFLSIYRPALLETYAKQAGGTTLYPFGRLFMVARR